MESKTKIILAVVAVLGVAYFTREKWMPLFKAEKTSGVCGCEEESNWTGNATYNDCHLKCTRAGGSTSECDKKCGRGTKTASAI